MLDAKPQTIPKQKRSRERRAQMVAHGLELLKFRDLEEVAISEITGDLGFSTGSFYSGFSDKAAFFVAVQEMANAHMVAWIEADIETPAFQALAMADRLQVGIDLVLRYFAQFTGVLRSALRYEHKLPAAWEPNRISAQRVADGLSHGLSGGQKQRMQLAVQMAFGTMVNALLHDPGPLRLDDPKFGTQLMTVLRPFLED